MTKKLITARWCTPCKMLKGKLADANYTIELIDAEEEAEYVNKLGIRSVPTLVIEDGDQVELITYYEKILENLLG
jgi:glutaredoxin